MDIDQSLRDAPVMDRNGYPYIIHPLMDGVPRVEPALLREFAQWAAAHPAMEDATVLLAPEAMGVPLAAGVALESGVPYLVIRKRSYGMAGETIAYCETGYNQSCLYINGLTASDKVVIIDDVISTGGTLDALLQTLKGMGAQIQGVLAFVDKGDKRQSLQDKHGVVVDAMRRITVEDGRVEVGP